MSRRIDPGTIVETRLAARRVESGYTQKQLAHMIGISLYAYRKLERGRHQNPPIRWLVNAALVLDCPLGEIVEDEWRSWLRFHLIQPASPPSGRLGPVAL